MARTGRPKGVVETKPRRTAARKLAEIALSQGLTPLQIMQATAQKAWEIAERLDEEDADEGAVLAAMQVAAIQAEKCAPYMHAKLASETHRVINDDGQRSADDIRREIEELDRLAAAAAASGDVAPPVPERPDRLVH